MKIKHLLFIATALLSHDLFSQMPILNSNPAITNKVIYLDFDGQVVSGTAWNSGNTINALPSTLSNTSKFKVWQRVSEDYRPFDVNITNDSLRFNAAPSNKRIRVVITPTSSWYSAAGGVAYVGSFTWGGTPGTPCWIFENQLGYSAKNVGEACSHEAGHTLSLRHHSTYSTTPSGTCTKTAEYDPGQGTGVTSWAPIMGVSYYKNVTTWYNGLSTTGCNVYQDDISNTSIGITGTPYLSFLPDDVGDNFATAKILNLTSLNLLDSGLITTTSDLDVYQFTICNNRNVTFNIQPWAMDTSSYDAANLDVRFKLYNSAFTLLSGDTSLTKLNALKGASLTPGTYYFTVDGGASNYYSDYGSIGKYYIRIKATNPPTLANTITLNPMLCLNQSTTLSYTSNGTPASWLWTVASTASTTTFSTQNPAFQFNTISVYTISLLATSSASSSCVVTRTVGISPAPVLTVSPASSICSGTSTQISASGANTYTWLPGNFSGGTQVVTPTVSTTYSVIGSINQCNASALVTVSVIPNFSMQVAVSSASICAGETISISVTGAPNYTINPGGFNTTAVVAPPVSTTYFIAGSNGACTKNASHIIIVSPAFNIHAAYTSTLVCEGESVSITATGGGNYVFNPGNITSNPAVVFPTGTVAYTVTGYNADQCPADTIVEIAAAICEGIVTHGSKPESVSIYPNPASGSIAVELASGCTRLEITDALGNRIVERKFASAKTLILPTGDWANGMYIVKAYFTGSQAVTKKVIVQH